MDGHDSDTLGCDRAACDAPSPLNRLMTTLIGRRVHGLVVDVRPTSVIRRGRADSYHVKQLAQHAAMGVTGLPLVANEIEVLCPQRGTSQPAGAEFGQWEARLPKTCVLLASGDDRWRSIARHHLTDHGFAVTTAADGVECVALLRDLTAEVDAIVLDTDLLWGGADGVLEHLRGMDGPTVPVVLLTSRLDTPPVSWCGGGAPVVSVLEKPVTVGTLLCAVRSAVSGGSVAHPARLVAGEEAPPPPA